MVVQQHHDKAVQHGSPLTCHPTESYLHPLVLIQPQIHVPAALIISCTACSSSCTVLTQQGITLLEHLAAGATIELARSLALTTLEPESKVHNTA